MHGKNRSDRETLYDKKYMFRVPWEYVFLVGNIWGIYTGNICTNRLKMLYLRDFRLLTSNRLLGIYQHFTNKNNSVF